MKQYEVWGTITVTVRKVVWASDEDDAVSKADNEFGGVSSYGLDGQLIGVDGEGETIEDDGYVEFQGVSDVVNDYAPDAFEDVKLSELIYWAQDYDSDFWDVILEELPDVEDEDFCDKDALIELICADEDRADAALNYFNIV